MKKKYIVKETFEHWPSGRADCPPYSFHKGEIHEFKPYIGKWAKDGEMIICEHLPYGDECFVWRADYFKEHFEPAEQP